MALDGAWPPNRLAGSPCAEIVVVTAIVLIYGNYPLTGEGGTSMVVDDVDSNLNEWIAEALVIAEEVMGQMAIFCPSCQTKIPERWAKFVVPQGEREAAREYISGFIRKPEGAPGEQHMVSITAEYMACVDCGELLVRLSRTHFYHDRETSEKEQRGVWPTVSSDRWLAAPRYTSRPIDPIVVSQEPDMARDYREAAQVLEFSPRLSALLSRRVLADVLEKYAKLTDFDLGERTKKFKADASYPSRLRDVADIPREVGNWTGHTKRRKDDQAVIVEASPEEAIWTLDVLDRLFDYFIVGPEKDKAMLAAVAAKQASIDQPIRTSRKRQTRARRSGKGKAP